MGMGVNTAEAFRKSQLGAGQVIPRSGRIFLSVNERDKPYVAKVASEFAAQGFSLTATSGTAAILRELGLEVEEVRKVYEGRPNIIDLIINHEIDLVINTPSGKNTARDSKAIRRTALTFGVPYCTTLSAALATAHAVTAGEGEVQVKSLQEYYSSKAEG